MQHAPRLTGALVEADRASTTDNANGLFDAGDTDLSGREDEPPDRPTTSVDSTHFTGSDGTTTWSLLQPDTRLTPCRRHADPGQLGALGDDLHRARRPSRISAGPLTVIVGGTTFVAFGTDCTLPAQWAHAGLAASNANGQAMVGAGALSMLVGLNLVEWNRLGVPTRRTTPRCAHRLLNGNAINMAYMYVRATVSRDGTECSTTDW